MAEVLFNIRPHLFTIVYIKGCFIDALLKFDNFFFLQDDDVSASLTHLNSRQIQILGEAAVAE
jgi:hypothetical protein